MPEQIRAMQEWKLLDLVFISFFRVTSDYFQVTVTHWQEALGGNGHYFIPVSIGVARIFDWGWDPNHKSRAMTSLEIFKKGTFCEVKIS